MPQSADDLQRTLQRIDGRGYKAYREIRGAFGFEGLTLYVDHVQGDPFAAPSKLRLRVPDETACIPPELFANPVRRMALEDFLVRQAARAIRSTEPTRRGSGKSGALLVDAGGQEVLERTAAVVTEGWVELRLQAGLPAAGRRVLGRQAEAMLSALGATAVNRYRDFRSRDVGRFVDQSVNKVVDGVQHAVFASGHQLKCV